MKKIFSILVLLFMQYATCVDTPKTTKNVSPCAGYARKLFPQSVVLILSNKLPHQLDYHEHIVDKKLIGITTNSILKDISLIIKSKYMDMLGVVDYFYTGEVETLAYTLSKKYPLQYIVVDSEFDILRAAKLREILGLPGQTYKSAIAFRDKLVMRNHIQKAGLRVPMGKAIKTPIDLIKFSQIANFPFILKPRRGWGSEDVILIDSMNKLDEVLSSNMFNASHESHLLAEKFIKGNMYFVEGLVLNGEIVFSWPSCYISECLNLINGNSLGSYILKPGTFADRLNTYAKKVLKALPTPKNTGFHLELFHTPEDELVFCEVASRIGGGRINEVYKNKFGIDLRKKFIQMQSGTLDKHMESLTHRQGIVGFVLFSSPHGPKSIFNAMSEKIPFEWVEQFHLEVNKGDVSSKKGLKSPFASAVICADSEEEFKERVKIITNWVNTHTSWQ